MNQKPAVVAGRLSAQSFAACNAGGFDVGGPDYVGGAVAVLRLHQLRLEGEVSARRVERGDSKPASGSEAVDLGVGERLDGSGDSDDGGQGGVSGAHWAAVIEAMP
jgi:hypothetical protein